MENAGKEDEPKVHLHKRSTEAWYNTVCGIKDTNIYVTLNRLLVTCDDCRKEI